jgi:hypothetical protein
MLITHDQAVVKCVSEQKSPQPKMNNISVKLELDGGLNMNNKKMQFSFKKFSVGIAVSSLLSMSVLP